MPGLEGFVAVFGPGIAIGVVLAFLAGGFAKGVVGFALPLIALSAMGSFLPIETAVALLVAPTLASNLIQSLRNGFGAAFESLRRYWRLNLLLIVTIALSAQLLTALSDRLLFGLLGVAITGFAASQLAGWRPSIRPDQRVRAETAAALVGGFFGGIGGIWGPPVVMYLLAAGVERAEMIRVQSLSFLAGSLVLVVAHLRSGVLDATTAPMSIVLIAPTLVAMVIGYRVQDLLDPVRFRQITLLVLVVAGLNLVRRAVM